MSDNNDLTRFDRNLANNLADFKRYGKDATLIKNIALYLAYEWQHQQYTAHLFEKSTLDPVHFAKIMNYNSYRTLLKPHPSPTQFLNKSEDEIKLLKGGHQDRNKQAIWDTDFCNALYTMFDQPLTFTYAGKTPSGLTFSRLEKLSFFKELSKYRNPVTGKIYYEYELSDEFKNNLARYFFKLNTAVYAKLRSRKLQDLYLRMSAYKEAAPDTQETILVNTISFDLLCRLANAHCSAFQDNKKHIRKAFDYLNSVLGYTFIQLTWAKDPRSAYLNRPLIELFKQPEEPQQATRDHYARFKLYSIDNLRKVFKTVSPHAPRKIDAVASFKKWMSEADAHYIEKWEAIREAYQLCYGTQITEEYLFKMHKYFYTDFISEL